jgi:acyl-CoA synthetase (AMP-forming)/AMP-acid ligase II
VLIELLRQAAAEVPDQPVVISADRSLTYAHCLGRSEAIARGLHARSIERAACVVHDVGDLVALLCASSATGMEACVYPDAVDETVIRGHATAFEHPVVVSDRRLALTSPPDVVSLGDLAGEGGELPAPGKRAPVLILTTGTTGRQKAARHDWARLVEPARRRQARPGTRWLLAYNPSQFAGLQIIMHALASRATLVVARSRQPGDALDAMRDLGVTHASGTPTFWRMVTSMLDRESVRELRLEQITLGGEAVPEWLLDELRRLFPSAHISQVYASTEFGSALSVRDGRSGLPVSLLDRGADADVQFRVVDGELQSRSRVGMLGYHGDRDAGDGWRPTGDLVEISDDRIHFVGRASDTINVGGVKVHPLPVEEAVGALDGVELARAYGRPNPVTGQIVAVDVVARPGVDTKRLDEAIRGACATLPPALRPRRVRFVAELEVRGDKISRVGDAVER